MSDVEVWIDGNSTALPCERRLVVAPAGWRENPDCR